MYPKVRQKGMRCMTARTPSYFLFAFLCIVLPISSQIREHYALVLQDPPVTAQLATREAARSLQAESYRAQIQSRQAALKSALASRNFNVSGFGVHAGERCIRRVHGRIA